MRTPEDIEQLALRAASKCSFSLYEPFDKQELVEFAKALLSELEQEPPVIEAKTSPRQDLLPKERKEPEEPPSLLHKLATLEGRA